MRLRRFASTHGPSFLGLLGDHVARWSHGTAAVGLLLLSWFQNLQKEYRVEGVRFQEKIFEVCAVNYYYISE